MNSGKNYIKKAYDALLAKMKKTEDENFLIPKKKEEESKEGESKPAEAAANPESDLSIVLQNEVRNLHF